MKWANGHQEALEQSLRVFSFLLIDAQQRLLVCFIQTLWQVFQGTPNTGRKTATEPVNLTDNPSEPMLSCEYLM